MNKIRNNSRISIGTYRNYILGGLCGILAIVSIFMTIEVSASGVEVANLEKTQKDLANQRREMEEQLVKNLSASGLQEKSEELGFIKPANLVYVSQLPPVAKLP